MAKRKEKLSLNELLEQALIKDEDKPYEVPSNWIWIDCCKIFDIAYGKNLPTKNLTETGYPVFGANGQIGFYSQYTYEKEQALMSCRGAYSGAMNMSLPYSYITNNSLVLSPRVNGISIKFIAYLFEALDKTNLISGSAQPQVTVQAFAGYPVPLMPLVEQQRIVDIIELLFEKLDSAKELAQNALDSFENRKTAILYKAFTGELTAKWREENGIILEEWEEQTLGKVCKSIFDGDHMPPPKSEEGVPFLVISNINKGYLNFENTRFVPKDYYDKISDTRKPQLGDVLYSIVGSYGIPVLVDDERQFCFQRHMALLKPLKIESKLLWYLLQTSEIYNKATEIATGTAQLTVPIRGLRELKFLLPQQLEQQEIVHILDNLLENEQRAKEVCDVIEKIDLMKKAILARAFRGELGTNDPHEESAVELLKEVLKEKI